MHFYIKISTQKSIDQNPILNPPKPKRNSFHSKQRERTQQKYQQQSPAISSHTKTQSPKYIPRNGNPAGSLRKAQNGRNIEASRMAHNKTGVSGPKYTASLASTSPSNSPRGQFQQRNQIQKPKKVSPPHSSISSSVRSASVASSATKSR